MVLLVEDTRALAETYQAYLAPQGWAVEAVETAAAAKAAVERAAPSVVVVDVNLPDGNGLDLLRWTAERLGAG